jgi:hypothetical protein
MPQPGSVAVDFPKRFFEPLELVITEVGGKERLKVFQIGDYASNSLTPEFFQNIFALKPGSYIADVALESGDTSSGLPVQFEVVSGELKEVLINIEMGR